VPCIWPQAATASSRCAAPSTASSTPRMLETAPSHSQRDAALPSQKPAQSGRAHGRETRRSVRADRPARSDTAGAHVDREQQILLSRTRHESSPCGRLNAPRPDDAMIGSLLSRLDHCNQHFTRGSGQSFAACAFRRLPGARAILAASVVALARSGASTSIVLGLVRRFARRHLRDGPGTLSREREGPASWPSLPPSRPSPNEKALRLDEAKSPGRPCADRGMTPRRPHWLAALDNKRALQVL